MDVTDTTKYLKELEKRKIMNNYKTFAAFYDSLTENVDYKVRSEYISNFFSRYKPEGHNVLDLACGTGTIAYHLSNMGYNVTGIDLSEDMLVVAGQKCNGSVSFIKADISNFSLENKYDYCVCSLDSINHLKNLSQVKDCFNCVSDSLVNGGVFVFDVNTVYKHSEVLSNNTFVFDEEDFFLCWDNEYLGDNTVRELLDFFVFNGENYDRYSEEIIEKAYELDEIIDALCDFEVLGIYDELTTNDVNNKTERAYFVCRKVK